MVSVPSWEEVKDAECSALSHRALGLHCDRFRDGADLKLDIAGRDVLVGADQQARALRRLESGVLDFERVGVRLNCHEIEHADFVGCRDSDVPRLFAQQGDLGACYDLTRWIDDGSDDAAGDRHLGEHCRHER